MPIDLRRLARGELRRRRALEGDRPASPVPRVSPSGSVYARCCRAPGRHVDGVRRVGVAGLCCCTLLAIGRIGQRVAPVEAAAAVSIGHRCRGVAPMPGRPRCGRCSCGTRCSAPGCSAGRADSTCAANTGLSSSDARSACRSGTRCGTGARPCTKRLALTMPMLFAICWKTRIGSSSSYADARPPRPAASASGSGAEFRPRCHAVPRQQALADDVELLERAGRWLPAPSTTGSACGAPRL